MDRGETCDYYRVKTTKIASVHYDRSKNNYMPIAAYTAYHLHGAQNKNNVFMPFVRRWRNRNNRKPAANEYRQNIRHFVSYTRK